MNLYNKGIPILRYILLLLLFLGYCRALQKDDDVINALPNITFEINFKQYSGFLNPKPGNHLHYWLVESSTNPKNDPLVLWLNGGPGCSSLLGLLSENGPFRVLKNNGNFEVWENPNSWNKAANILYLEAPVNVGYSYSDSNSTNYNDDLTAKDNALALKQFFDRFPEYKNRSFYIAGESYGGVYIPTLSRQIIKMMKESDLTDVNFKGFMIGNGALSRKMLTNSVISLLFYRGIISDSDWNELSTDCCQKKSPVECDLSQYVRFNDFGDPIPIGKNEKCSNKVIQFAQNATWLTANDVYNTYQDCYSFDSNAPSYHDISLRKTTNKLRRTMFSSSIKNMFSNGINPFIDQGSMINTISTDSMNGYPCYGEDYGTEYLNMPDVRKALNINLPKEFKFEQCNDDINEKYYKQQYPDMTTVFDAIFDYKYPINILIFNGDVDLACNFLGDQWFVEELMNKRNLTLLHDRQPWIYNRNGTKTLAGYAKSWKSDKISFDLLTVKGAGHMVPTDRPGPALQMFSNFLSSSNNYNESSNYNLAPSNILPKYSSKPTKEWTRKQADRVWRLPGVTYELNFKQYSGYLHGVDGNYLHYWFVESQSNPLTDPLILWLTGGPGCSGLMALLTELGPFHPNPDGETLFENVYSWNKVGNILFLESPRGVGFSVQNFDENPDTEWNDEKSANDAFLALKDFLTVFTEYKNRPFYITGESYGGVYVPTLTDLLIKKIKSGEFPELNLKGMSIGNGELSAVQQLNSALMMGYFHGLYGKSEFDKLRQYCCDHTEPIENCDFSKYINIKPNGDVVPKYENNNCSTLVADLGQNRIWNSINNVYNIYQDCYEQTEHAFGSMTKKSAKMRLLGFIDQGADISTVSTDNQGGFICYGNSAAESWINLPDVRAALHVSPTASNWTACNDTINSKYIQQHNDTTSVFQSILDSGYPLHVLVYNGDVDQACNFLGDEWFIENFAKNNQMNVLKKRNAWRYENQIAGYAKTFDNGKGLLIDLLTVKGAGHLVPTDRPGPTLQMMANYFRNQDYSNPTIIDTNISPLKREYKVKEELTNFLKAENSSLSDIQVRYSKANIRRRNKQKKNVKSYVKTNKRPDPCIEKSCAKIENLPGLTFNPSYNQYSGYLKASENHYLHYWLVETPVKENKDKLILWLNGGPGCSSLGGFLEELGPFHVNPDGETLFENQFAWTKAGNVLFLEAPYGVGFSYSTDDSESEHSDTLTASDTVNALKYFFEQYDGYSNKSFYITGESYGGVYVPTLTDLLIKNINNGSVNINLQGIAIGNGELSEFDQINSAVSLLYFRGIHGKEDWDSLRMCCPNSSVLSYCDFSKYYVLDSSGNAWPKYNDSSIEAKCGELVVNSFLDVWETDNDVYNTYQDCYTTGDSISSKLRSGRGRRVKRSIEISPFLPAGFVDQAKRINYKSTDANMGFNCYSGEAAENYLNLAEVQKALHVSGQWTDCNLKINENYKQQNHNTTSVFNSIFNSNYPLRILIYNGDVDMACQFLGDQWFIERLAQNQKMDVTKEFGQWNYTQGNYLPRIGGYWKRFDTSDSKIEIDLLTVKGGGHFVPKDRPGPALQMINNFVNHKDYSSNLTISIKRSPLFSNYTESVDSVPRHVADKVFELPGATFPILFNQHAGYLDTKRKGHELFYWFMESQTNNRSDPIILWLQGGPGCASTGGLFSEIGPFFVNPDGETLFENIYSWNKAAHILAIDSPRSIGFSFNTNKEESFDDDQTAEDTASALDDFFKTYSMFKNNEFYIAGESYAGVYIPTLTREILKNYKNINLKGIAIGNGMLSAIKDVNTLPDFLYMHGIYDKNDWEKLRECCRNNTDQSQFDSCHYDYYITINASAAVVAKSFNNEKDNNCAKLVQEMSFDRNWNALYDQYNLYDDCYTVQNSPFEEMYSEHKNIRSRAAAIFEKRNLKHNNMDPLYTDANGGYSCWKSSAIHHYLNMNHVRYALHVPKSVQEWQSCTDFNYTSLYNDTTSVFEDIMKLTEKNFQILIYNGDVDTVCSMFEAKSMITQFADKNNFTRTNQQEWYYGNTISGYFTDFTRNNMNIKLLTVKGAGHMVPSDRPGPALQMINSFIHRQNYNTSITIDMKRKPLLPEFTQKGEGPLTGTTNQPTSSPVSSTPGKTERTTTTTTTTSNPIETTTKISAEYNCLVHLVQFAIIYVLCFV